MKNIRFLVNITKKILKRKNKTNKITKKLMHWNKIMQQKKKSDLIRITIYQMSNTRNDKKKKSTSWLLI